MPKFKKDDLKGMLGGGSEALKVVSDVITGKSRWSLHHTTIFQEKSTGRFFRTHYSEGPLSSRMRARSSITVRRLRSRKSTLWSAW